MAERLYYSKAGPIDPVALVMENVAIYIKRSWKCYRVKFLEPLPKSRPLVFDQGAIVAGAATGDRRLINLDQITSPVGMAQLRWYPVDDIQVTLKIGQAEARFTTARITATADRFTRLIDPDFHTTEFIVHANNTPFLNVTNPTAYPTAMSRVSFFGYRFLLEDLKIDVPTADEAIYWVKIWAMATRALYSGLVFVPSGSD